MVVRVPCLISFYFLLTQGSNWIAEPCDEVQPHLPELSGVWRQRCQPAVASGLHQQDMRVHDVWAADRPGGQARAAHTQPRGGPEQRAADCEEDGARPVRTLPSTGAWAARPEEDGNAEVRGEPRVGVVGWREWDPEAGQTRPDEYPDRIIVDSSAFWPLSVFNRTMIFRDIERLIHPQRVVNRIVYDLDALLKETSGESDAKQRTSSKEHLKPAQARKASNCRSVGQGLQSVAKLARPISLRPCSDREASFFPQHIRRGPIASGRHGQATEVWVQIWKWEPQESCTGEKSANPSLAR